MVCLELTLSTLSENLALDEALLLQAESEQGHETLRFWEWTSLAVVLGAGCRLADDVDEAACKADRVLILRRSSGGGTVLLGRGCLLFSLILGYERSPFLREIRPSYCYILGLIRDALADLLPGVACAGTSDLAADGLKFSGNSQQRKRHHLLHHGTLLYDFDIQSIGRYLRLPSRQPAYRAGREHAAFVRNLPCDAAELRKRMCAAWDAKEPITDWPSDTVDRLVAQKYGRTEWHQRR